MIFVTILRNVSSTHSRLPTEGLKAEVT